LRDDQDGMAARRRVQSICIIYFSLGLIVIVEARRVLCGARNTPATVDGREFHGWAGIPSAPRQRGRSVRPGTGAVPAELDAQAHAPDQREEKEPGSRSESPEENRSPGEACAKQAKTGEAPRVCRDRRSRQNR